MKNIKNVMGIGVLVVVLLILTLVVSNGKNLQGFFDVRGSLGNSPNIYKPISIEPNPATINDPITRQDLAKLLVTNAKNDPNINGGPHFSDVPVSSPYYV